MLLEGNINIADQYKKNVIIIYYYKNTNNIMVFYKKRIGNSIYKIIFIFYIF